MNQEIIEKLIKALIVKKDYILIPGPDGRRLMHPELNVLMKQGGQFMSYIQVIDVDRVSLEWIRARLEQKDSLLMNLQEKSMAYAYAVFVFSRQSEPQKRALIEEWQREYETKTDAFKCFIIDADEKKAEKLFNRPYKDSGLYKVMNQMLNASVKEGYEDKTVEELADQKREDYELALAAKKPIATYMLTAVNIAVYLALCLYSLKSGISYDQLLIKFGAKVNSNILSGEYWRLLTPIFLHGSLMHLLVNCYSLLIVGSLVERLFGIRRLTASYLIAGFIGNIGSFLFVEGYSVGASGAIFGLMGMLLYFGLEKPLQFKVYFGRNILTTILINLVYGLANPGIDNFAHLGGLIGGFLAIGMLSRPVKKTWYCNRALYALILLVLTAGGIGYGFTNNESQVTREVQKLEQLEKDENWKQLEVQAEAVLALEPKQQENKVLALWSLIKAQLMQGEYEKAIPYCRQLIEISPENGHYLLGIIYYDSGRQQEAYEELNAAKKAGNDSKLIDELLNSMK